MYYTNPTYYDFWTRKMPPETLKQLDVSTSVLTNRPFGLNWLVFHVSGLAILFILTWKSREFHLNFAYEKLYFLLNQLLFLCYGNE